MELSSFLLLSTMILIMQHEEHTSALPHTRPHPDHTPAYPESYAGKGSPLELQTRALCRTKRCSCENLKDRECVYFCHIGIVWVNTPSQVIPYGVGSLHTRLQRDVNRCVCTNKRDSQCLEFCSRWYSQIENASVLRNSPRKWKERHKIREQQRQTKVVQKP
ncbi:uncharacterized protein LOC143522492 [Brachyhypopomus gauderio]|uniref:uncharacterized protein LOC143522492 n=1 Tax=Brachyhypopomus gauderio TaxID=698409 RepID=UPI0040437CC2